MLSHIYIFEIINKIIFNNIAIIFCHRLDKVQQDITSSSSGYWSFSYLHVSSPTFPIHVEISKVVSVG